jgi:membrane protease YdiL (CAAX protease family)
MADANSQRRDGLALAFAMTFPSLMSWIEFWVLPGEQRPSGGALAVVFGAGKVVQFAFPLLYTWWTEPQELRLRRPHGRGLGLAIGFSVIFAVGLFVVYSLVQEHTTLLADIPGKLADLLARLHANNAVVFFAMALFISVPHSFLEEYYWRWFVFGRLQRRLPLAASIGLASVAFMAHHVFVLSYYFPGRFWVAAVPFSLCVAVAGAFWCWLYHRYQSLYAPWVSHVLADAAIMVVGYEMVASSWQ